MGKIYPVDRNCIIVAVIQQSVSCSKHHHKSICKKHSMDEDSKVSNIANDEGTNSEMQGILHPWPYLKELFDVVGSKNGKCIVQNKEP